MDELKNFVQSNLQRVENAKPMVGDEERFMTRLAQENTNRRIHFKRSIQHRRVPFYRIIALPVAACIIALLGYGLFYKLTVLNQRKELTKVITDFYTEVTTLSGEIRTISLAAGDAEAAMNDAIIENITYESVPFYNQLPEEMSEKKKIAIMKEYYSQKLEGIRRFKVLISESLSTEPTE